METAGMDSDGTSEVSEELGETFERKEFSQEEYDRICGRLPVKKSSGEKEGAEGKKKDRPDLSTVPPARKVEDWLLKSSRESSVVEIEEPSKGLKRKQKKSQDDTSNASSSHRKTKKSAKIEKKTAKKKASRKLRNGKKVAIKVEDNDKNESEEEECDDRSQISSETPKLKNKRVRVKDVSPSVKKIMKSHKIGKERAMKVIEKLRAKNEKKKNVKVSDKESNEDSESEKEEEKEGPDDNSQASTRDRNKKNRHNKDSSPSARKGRKSTKIEKKQAKKVIRKLRGRNKEVKKMEESDEESKGDSESEKEEEGERSDSQASTIDRNKKNQFVKDCPPRKAKKSANIENKQAKKNQKSLRIGGRKREVKEVEDNEVEDEEMNEEEEKMEEEEEVDVVGEMEVKVVEEDERMIDVEMEVEVDMEEEEAVDVVEMNSPEKKKRKKDDKPVKEGTIQSGVKKSEEKARSVNEKSNNDKKKSKQETGRKDEGPIEKFKEEKRKSGGNEKSGEVKRKIEESSKEEKRKSVDVDKTAESRGKKETNSTRDQKKDKKEEDRKGDAKRVRRDSSTSKGEQRKSDSSSSQKGPAKAKQTDKGSVTSKSPAASQSVVRIDNGRSGIEFVSKQVAPPLKSMLTKKASSTAKPSDNSVLPACVQKLFDDLNESKPYIPLPPSPTKYQKQKETMQKKMDDRLNRHLGLPPTPTQQEVYDKRKRMSGESDEREDGWDPKNDAFRPPRRRFGKKALLRTPVGVEKRGHDVFRRPEDTADKPVLPIVAYARTFITPRGEQQKYQDEVYDEEEEEAWPELEDIPISVPVNIPLIPPIPPTPSFFEERREDDREGSPSIYCFSPSDNRVGLPPIDPKMFEQWKNEQSRPMETQPLRDTDWRREEDRGRMGQTPPNFKPPPSPRTNNGRDHSRDERRIDGYEVHHSPSSGRYQSDDHFDSYDAMESNGPRKSFSDEEERESRKEMEERYHVGLMKDLYGENWREELKKMNKMSPSLSPPPNDRPSLDSNTIVIHNDDLETSNGVKYRFILIDDECLPPWMQSHRFPSSGSVLCVPFSPEKKCVAILAAGPFRRPKMRPAFEKMMKEKRMDFEFMMAPPTRDTDAMNHRLMAAILCYSEDTAKELLENKMMRVGHHDFIEIGRPGEVLVNVLGITEEVNMNDLIEEITDVVETLWGYLVECSLTAEDPLTVHGKIRFFYGIHASRASCSCILPLSGGRSISFAPCPPEKSTPWITLKGSEISDCESKREEIRPTHPPIFTNGQYGPQPVPPPSLISLSAIVGPIKSLSTTISSSNVSLPSSGMSTESQEPVPSLGGALAPSRFASLTPLMGIPPPGLVDPAMLRYMIKREADPRDYQRTISIPPIPVPASLIPLPPPQMGPIAPPSDITLVLPHPDLPPVDNFFFQPPPPPGVNQTYRRRTGGAESVQQMPETKNFVPATYLKHVQGLLPKTEEDEILLFVRPTGDGEQQPDWDAVREHFKDDDCSSRVYGGIVSLRFTGGRAKEKAQVQLCKDGGLHDVHGQSYAVGVTFPVLFVATNAVSKLLVYEALKEKFGSVIEVEKKCNSPMGKPVYKAYFESIDKSRQAATEGITVEGSILTNCGPVPE